MMILKDSQPLEGLLKEDREILFEIIDAIDIPLIVFREDMSILFANERFLCYSKIRKDDLYSCRVDLSHEKIKEEMYFFHIDVKIRNSGDIDFAAVMNIIPIEHKSRFYYVATIHESYYDSLTRFPAMSVFRQNLDKVIDMAKASGKILALIFVDVNKFKFINDSYGHSFGDSVISKIAGILEAGLKYGDLITRRSGDEFIILLNNLTVRDEVTGYLEGVFRQLETPLEIDSQKIKITLSAGIALFPFDGETATELLEKADYAMYKAKEIQGSIYLYFSHEDRKELEIKRQYEQTLLEAYRDNFKNFDIVFQPVFRHKKENLFSLVSFEAFVRWKYDDIHLADTRLFLEIAKEKGILQEIDKYVFFKVLEILKEFHEYTKPVHVNVSDRIFYDPDFPELIKEIFRVYPFAANTLILEIKESTLYRDKEYSFFVLESLKTYRARICVENFAQNSTDLKLLGVIRPDFLKIDTSHFLEIYEKDKAFAGLLKSLCHIWKTKFIFSRVENKELFRKIRHIMPHCYYQGYYLSKLFYHKENANLFIRRIV